MQTGLRLVSKVAGLWLAVFAVTAVIPHAPVLLPSNFDARKWEILSPLHAEEGGALSRGEIAQIQKAQSSLLQREFAGLATSHRGETEIYTLAIAGWADNVFIKELDGGSAAIASVLPIKGTVRLINHRKTVNTVPLANFQNFRQAVHAIGSIMDKDNDVLILLMTSHGDRTGFALQLPGSITELTPRQVAAGLDGEGIKNRVVIVSGVLFRNIRAAIGERQHHRHDGGGCAPLVIRLRARARLDLFRRCLLPAKPASRSGLRKRLRPCSRPDPPLGNDGRRGAVKSASPLWQGARRQAGAVLCHESGSIDLRQPRE